MYAVPVQLEMEKALPTKLMERTHEKQRKHYTPEENVAILRRHLLEKEPTSKLCDELGMQPTVFYRWQKELFENGAAEKKSQSKDDVLAELMAEHVALRKTLGNSDRDLGPA